jgi:hypothetical protein
MFGALALRQASRASTVDLPSGLAAAVEARIHRAPIQAIVSRMIAAVARRGYPW